MQAQRHGSSFILQLEAILFDQHYLFNAVFSVECVWPIYNKVHCVELYPGPQFYDECVVLL